MSSAKGFTLLEVIIAMAILAFLTIFTSQSIQRATQMKTRVQSDIDHYSSVRDALKIMESDINKAFHYRDISIELFNAAQKEREQRKKNKSGKTPEKKPGDPTTANPPADPAPSTQGENPDEFKLKQQKLFTHFLGLANSLNFVTLNNVRLHEDSQVSDQAEIGYFLRPCRSREDRTKSSQCLWRRLSPIVDDFVDKDGDETVLLEHVTKFNLRYLGPGKQDEWLPQWLTNEQGDSDSKDQFPFAVEITLEIKRANEGENARSLSMTTVAAIRNPNNPKKEADPNAAGANNAGTPTGN